MRRRRSFRRGRAGGRRVFSRRRRGRGMRSRRTMIIGQRF